LLASRILKISGKMKGKERVSFFIKDENTS
jgi:hypothetical protein